MSWRQPGIDDRLMMQEILELLATDRPGSHHESTASTTLNSGVDHRSNQDVVRREFRHDSMQGPSYSGESLNGEMKEIVDFLGSTGGVGTPGSRSQGIAESSFGNNSLSPQDGLSVPHKGAASAVVPAHHR